MFEPDTQSHFGLLIHDLIQFKQLESQITSELEFLSTEWYVSQRTNNTY